MTEAQIVAAIQNYVTSNKGVTNFDLSPEQIRDEVDTLRSRIILEMDKGTLFKKPYLAWVQPCALKVEKNADKELFVTIPRVFIHLTGEPAIAYVGGTDRKSPYRTVTGNHHLWVQHDDFVGSRPLAIYEDGIIKIKNIAPTDLLVVAVFYKPSLVAGYDPGYDAEDQSEGSQYPAPDGVIDEMIGKTAESYIRSMYRVPPQANTQADAPQLQRKQ